MRKKNIFSILHSLKVMKILHENDLERINEFPNEEDVFCDTNGTKTTLKSSQIE